MKSLIETFKQKIKTRKAKISIIGFGYIGTCIGAVLADRGFSVLGVDNNEAIVSEISQGYSSINEPKLETLIQKNVDNGKLKATSDFSEIVGSDVVIVTVGTPLNDDFTPNSDMIISATNSIGPHINSDTLIILKSTVPPNTTSEVVAPIIEKYIGKENPKIAFCPERLAEGNAISEFLQIPVVIGGYNTESASLASIFWSESLNVETILTSCSTTAELVKLADNLWIDLNISLANEIAIISDKLDVDSLEVISAANTLPKGKYNVNILYPGIGVGGYCLTKDPWFVYHLGKSFGLDLRTPETSRMVNDSMPEYTYNSIVSTLSELGVDLNKAIIGVLGVSFKNNTGDCRFTPTKEVISQLSSKFSEVRVFDSWVNTNDQSGVTKLPFSKSIENTIAQADCVAILAGHDIFKDYPISKFADFCNKGALIFDGRGIYDREEIALIKNLGLNYKGIGR